jgi:hypothetical protein
VAQKMASTSAISASTTDGSSTPRVVARASGSMALGGAGTVIVGHCVITASLHCQHTDHSRRRCSRGLGSTRCPAPAQTLTGSLAAVPLCTGSPLSVITLASSIAWAASERPTVILRGLAFSATGITSRSTPSW